MRKIVIPANKYEINIAEVKKRDIILVKTSTNNDHGFVCIDENDSYFVTGFDGIRKSIMCDNLKSLIEQYNAYIFYVL